MSPKLTHSVEAIVIGSGFGGAVTACRLAQAGFDVLVLERGRRYEQGDFPDLPPDGSLLPDPRRWSWSADQGLWDVVDLEEMVAVQAAGYGGGSLIYANVHLRPPGEVFDERWPERYRGGRMLQPFYDLAAYMLDVSPVDAHPKFHENLVKTDQLRRAADHLGRRPSFFYPPLAIRYEDGDNVHGVRQSRCTGCGACVSGCPERAKSTLDLNYLALAERHGARVVTQSEVVGLRERRDGSWVVRCFDHLEAQKVVYHARYVFLCAGSLHSTRLLARTALRRKGRRARSLAGVGYFPGGDAIGIAYDTTHAQYPSYGPTITAAVTHWESADRGSFFLIEDGGYAAALDRFVASVRAPAWLDRNRLSTVGQAAVGPTGRAPPPPPRQAPGGLVPQSGLDDVIDAMAGGAFGGIVSKDATRAFSYLAARARDPLLFSPIVDRTIQGSIQESLQRFSLLRRLSPNGSLLSMLTRAGQSLVRLSVGSADSIAGQAANAILTTAGLSPPEVVDRTLGYGVDRPERRAVFLGMGRDAASGVLHYDGKRDRLVADLDLFVLAPGYAREQAVMTDIAQALGGELRTNPAWAFLGKPITVHNQGGCRMSDDPRHGVTDPFGKVHGCEGLFILDGSVLCTSVGVNPSATIAAIAESAVLRFIRSHRGEAWPQGNAGAGATEYARHRKEAASWAERARKAGWALSPPGGPAQRVEPRSQPLGMAFDEEMDGYYSMTESKPPTDAEHRRLETRGRPRYPITATLTLQANDLAAFFEDESHSMDATGKIAIRLPHATAVESFAVQDGRVELMVPRHKPYGIRPEEKRRRAAQVHAAGSYKTRVGEASSREERFLRYSLPFADTQGRRWRLRGYKRIADDPSLDAWREASSLYVELLGPPVSGTTHAMVTRGGGVIHVELMKFLFSQIPSIRTIRGDGAARDAWAIMQFASFFLGTLQRVAMPEIATALDTFFRNHHAHLARPASARTT